MAITAVLTVTFTVVHFGLSLHTWEGHIPPSCEEPSTIDYSKVGRPDYGPYVVKFTSWNNFPWGTTAHAIVGHGLAADLGTDYGVHVELTATDIHQFRCRWTNEGVTIIEPDQNGTGQRIERFVSAKQFLGGR